MFLGIVPDRSRYMAPGMHAVRGRCGHEPRGLRQNTVGFEDLDEGRASQRKLASLSFDTAGFGHGKPIARDASRQFRNKWGNKSCGSAATAQKSAA